MIPQSNAFFILHRCFRVMEMDIGICLGIGCVRLRRPKRNKCPFKAAAEDSIAGHGVKEASDLAFDTQSFSQQQAWIPNQNAHAQHVGWDLQELFLNTCNQSQQTQLGLWPSWWPVQGRARRDRIWNCLSIVQNSVFWGEKKIINIWKLLRMARIFFKAGVHWLDNQADKHYRVACPRLRGKPHARREKGKSKTNLTGIFQTDNNVLLSSNVLTTLSKCLRIPSVVSRWYKVNNTIGILDLKRGRKAVRSVSGPV